MDQNQFDHQQYYREPEGFYNLEKQEEQDRKIALYVAKVMGWMCVGLFVTLASAAVCLAVPSVRLLLFGTNAYYAVFVVQLVLVLAFTFTLNKISAGTATVLYLLYSMFTGVTFSVLAVVFTMSSIVFVFGLTGLIFLMMAVYGYVTKQDLTRIGTLAFFGLIGIILTSILNMLIFNSSAVELLICCFGIVIFMVLIGYDTQKIEDMYITATETGHEAESDVVRKIAIFGAFQLYLDFINLFIRLLQLVGRRRS